MLKVLDPSDCPWYTRSKRHSFGHKCPHPKPLRSCTKGPLLTYGSLPTNSAWRGSQRSVQSRLSSFTSMLDSDHVLGPYIPPDLSLLALLFSVTASCFLESQAPALSTRPSAPRNFTNVKSR